MGRDPMEKAIVQVDTSEQPDERRKSERLNLLVRVTYQSIDELFSEFAHNINEGGVFIESDNPMEPGASVALQFKLPGGDNLIEVDGVVVRTSRGETPGELAGMGIEFGPLNSEARQRINQLVRRLRSNV